MSPFVLKLDEAQIALLSKDLIDQGFVFTKPAHTHFQAKRTGLSLTVYLSGKAVLQGKNAQEFLEFYMEPHVLLHCNYTHEAPQDTTPRMGSDEAGKGDFFGPLCVACVYANQEQIKELKQLGVTDSKKLSDTKARTLARQIASGVAYEVIVLEPERYNRVYPKFSNLNVLLASLHIRCIEALCQKTGATRVIVDQFARQSLLESMVKKKGLALDLVQRTHAESDVVVAAASILARASFLKSLEKLGASLGYPLPKGAGPRVVDSAKMFVREMGAEALFRVAKKHFKTWNQVLSGV